MLKQDSEPWIKFIILNWCCKPKHLFPGWLADWLTHSLTHLLTHPLTQSPTYSPTYSRTHSLIHSLTHPPIHSLIHLLTHSPTHLLTHSLPRSLTRSLTHPFIHSLTLTNSLTHHMTIIPWSLGENLGTTLQNTIFFINYFAANTENCMYVVSYTGWWQCIILSARSALMNSCCIMHVEYYLWCDTIISFHFTLNFNHIHKIYNCSAPYLMLAMVMALHQTNPPFIRLLSAFKCYIASCNDFISKPRNAVLFGTA